jgi:NACHT domain
VFINPGDVADGVLVNALWAVGQMVARPRAARRTASEPDLAGWMNTEALTKDGLPGAKLEIPELAEADAAELEAALKRDEVQGALQALFAARLTDAPETDAARAREAVRLALRGAPYAEQFSDYYDRKIGYIVGDLEGRVGLDRLSQVRNEAYNSRIIALLGAIERQVTALADPERGNQAEAEFLDRYRRQVRARHGKLEPPDFERRRRVPIEKIYVSTSIYTYGDTRVDFGWTPVGKSSLNVMKLATRFDRTVLLGDPGGGKTTATNVLANYFASDPTRKVPFVVTLRQYAAKEPPEFSITGHIEWTLKTLYQSAAPNGLVERLLRTGQALVIFDGLDELLDTSRRRDVSDRVEQFCCAYPLTRVLVTSRVVGYDQAQLDVEQFTCYRLGGFDEPKVWEYVRKWFMAQENVSPAEAQYESEAFLTESAGTPDLRYNPLMLSLMCILYRGAGSLPRDRAGIYARCAELLLGKWDESRRIHHQLQAGHLVEPAIRHLAWWLFNSQDSRSAVTERALVNEAAKFLHGRGFESEEEARAAAKEFVEFCSGRMWVLSDAGTTADGDKLYAFTHRTFLEYFAAAHLATVSDTPEDLARILAPQVKVIKGWNLIGELAMQIKDRTSDRGTDRIYATLLDSVPVPEDRGPLLTFLVDCQGSARPSPTTLRSLTRALLDYRYAKDTPILERHPLLLLLTHSDNHEQLIADEMSSRIAAMVMSDNEETRVEGLLIPLEIRGHNVNAFWSRWSAEQANRYAADTFAEAVRSSRLRTPALTANFISLEQALEMPGGLGALMEVHPQLLHISLDDPYPASLCLDLRYQPSSGTGLWGAKEDSMKKLVLIGHNLAANNPDPPWARTISLKGISMASLNAEGIMASFNGEGIRDRLNSLSGLGFAAIWAMYEEIAGADRSPLVADLPMPTQFKKLFQDWVAKRVDFVEILGE